MWNFSGEILAGYGAIPPENVRSVEQGEIIVDTDSTRLVLTQEIVQRLGLPITSEIAVRYADNRTARKPIARGVALEIMGRRGTSEAPLSRQMVKPLLGWLCWKNWTYGLSRNGAFSLPTLSLLIYPFIIF
jgi:predicted aspartyl protease